MEDKERKARDTQKKTDLRVKKTKRAIYNALVELLKKKNLENITVLELTEAAEINKSTFYLHYSDIFDLYQEALASHIKDVLVKADILQYLFTDPGKFSTWLVLDFWNPDNMRNDPFFHDSNLVYNRTLSYHICNAFTEQIIAEGLIEPSRENVLKLEFFFTGIAFIRHAHPEEDNSAMIEIIAESLQFLFKDEMGD
ncbi:MAG: TetR/AcrR family transcriptional regulator [Lachnospiraceae bacterium]|nr:TetR/AcrR family transcriptional regulator [Lachnospiraceae bacterium]